MCEGEGNNNAAYKLWAHQLSSKVWSCHSVSDTSVNSPAVTRVHMALPAAAVREAGLWEPSTFMPFNLLSSRRGCALNKSFRRLYDSCGSLVLCYSYEMPVSFFLNALSWAPSFLSSLFIFLFLIKLWVPSKWFIRCFSAHLLHHSL